MIGYISQNGFNAILKQFSLADPNIKSYGFGSLYNQNGDPRASQLYFGMWCQPTNSQVDEYVVTRTYQILIYDLIFQDSISDNENKVISDCEEIAFRLIRFLKTKSDTFDVSGIPSISPFTDRFLDDVSGVIIDLSVEFNWESSDCEDPDYDFPIVENNI